jgi:hypothetical protein
MYSTSRFVSFALSIFMGLSSAANSDSCPRFYETNSDSYLKTQSFIKSATDGWIKSPAQMTYLDQQMSPLEMASYNYALKMHDLKAKIIKKSGGSLSKIDWSAERIARRFPRSNFAVAFWARKPKADREQTELSPANPKLFEDSVDLWVNDIGHYEYQRKVEAYEAYAELKNPTPEEINILKAREESIRRNFPHSEFARSGEFGKNLANLAERISSIALKHDLPRFLSYELSNGRKFELDIVSESEMATILREHITTEKEYFNLLKQHESLERSLAKLQIYKPKDQSPQSPWSLITHNRDNVSQHTESWKNLSSGQRAALAEKLFDLDIVGSRFYINTLMKTINEVRKARLLREENQIAETRDPDALDEFFAEKRRTFYTPDLISFSKASEHSHKSPKEIADAYLDAFHRDDFLNEISYVMVGKIRQQLHAQKTELPEHADIPFGQRVSLLEDIIKTSMRIVLAREIKTSLGEPSLSDAEFTARYRKAYLLYDNKIKTTSQEFMQLAEDKMKASFKNKIDLIKNMKYARQELDKIKDQLVFANEKIEALVSTGRKDESLQDTLDQLKYEHQTMSEVFRNLYSSNKEVSGLEEAAYARHLFRKENSGLSQWEFERKYESLNRLVSQASQLDQEIQALFSGFSSLGYRHDK